MKRQFILLKETPVYKKGAIFEEECDDGDQNYECVNEDTHCKFNISGWGWDAIHREAVMKSPKWFAEVKPVWLTMDEHKKVKELLKKMKK